MKNILFIALCMSCLCSCSQSHDIAGEYEKLSKSGSVQYLLTLDPDGTFQFDSYTIRQMDGNNLRIKGSSTAEPSMSGRGTWSAENGVIYFKTNSDTDIDYNNTLDLDDTKAKFKYEPSKDSSNKKANAKLEFLESGIFWINGIELEKRD